MKSILKNKSNHTSKQATSASNLIFLNTFFFSMVYCFLDINIIPILNDYFS